MKDLIERLEKATGPDPELGRAVLLACGWSKTCVGYYMGQQFYWGSPDRKITFDDDTFHRHDPTRSLDAALTLVPEGWAAILYTAAGQAELYSTVPTRRRGIQIRVSGRPSLAIAICIAALRARSTVDRKPEDLAPCSLEPSSAPQRDMQEVEG